MVDDPVHHGIVGNKGYKIERKREGGPGHEYWKYRIAEFLKGKGYQVEIEKPIGEGETVDIVATKDGKSMAIEIETGKSDAFENIRKCRAKDFSEVWIVCLNEGARRPWLNNFKDMEDGCSQKIRVISLKELFTDQEFDPANSP